MDPEAYTKSSLIQKYHTQEFDSFTFVLFLVFEKERNMKFLN